MNVIEDPRKIQVVGDMCDEIGAYEDEGLYNPIMFWVANFRNQIPEMDLYEPGNFIQSFNCAEAWYLDIDKTGIHSPIIPITKVDIERDETELHFVYTFENGRTMEGWYSIGEDETTEKFDKLENLIREAVDYIFTIDQHIEPEYITFVGEHWY